MKPIGWILMCVLFGSVAAQASAPSIRLTLSLSGYGASGGYLVDKPMAVSCAVENIGNMTQEVKWQDHHSYHGTLPYPVSMTASIWDLQGKEIAKDVTQYVLWSSTFEEMPGDRILLRPGQKFIRVIQLDKVLSPTVPRLAPGSYRVRLKIPEATSNLLTIVVKEEPNKAPEPTTTSVMPRANERRIE